MGQYFTLGELASSEPGFCLNGFPLVRKVAQTDFHLTGIRKMERIARGVTHHEHMLFDAHVSHTSILHITSEICPCIWGSQVGCSLTILSFLRLPNPPCARYKLSDS